ncbi:MULTISPECIES: hypothetical protein [Paraburkholderia]|uniref:hypothetical protein n=1 Tax=Paraburkholderia TaxID=1822464 RepID=UPI0013A6DD94|nr:MULTISPECIES: hypothetical protein [Paraburkholderia]MDH6153575.1 hypothetical protein [Paraburkholderia sp. WSM4179]
MAKPDIFAVATAFVDWARPWTFFGAVMANPALTASDRADIEKIWLEVCEFRHWLRNDLSQGSASADYALGVAFPWLPDQVRAQFVRAAAYQWR